MVNEYIVGKTGSKISGSPRWGRNIDSLLGYLVKMEWHLDQCRTPPGLDGTATFCQRLQNHFSSSTKVWALNPALLRNPKSCIPDHDVLFMSIGLHRSTSYGRIKVAANREEDLLELAKKLQREYLHWWKFWYSTSPLIFAAVRHLSSCCLPSMTCSSRIADSDTKLVRSFPIQKPHKYVILLDFRQQPWCVQTKDISMVTKLTSAKKVDAAIRATVNYLVYFDRRSYIQTDTGYVPHDKSYPLVIVLESRYGWRRDVESEALARIK